MEFLLGEFPKYFEFLPLILQGFLLTFILTPLIGKFARDLGVLDKPPSANDKKDPERHRRLEKAPRPLWGGIAVLLPFLILSVVHLPLTVKTASLLVGVMILLAVGVIDDMVRLSWKSQFVGQFIAIFVTIIMGVGIQIINNPFNGDFHINFLVIPVEVLGYSFNIEIIGHLLYIFWVLLCINAVKWSSGTDGLMEGIVAIASLIFVLVGIRTFDDTSAVFSAILLGCIGAFLFFNFHPSKIFSGSAGKSVYGFILAVLAVLSEAKFAVAVLVLALPIVDMLWVMFQRARRSKEKNPIKVFAAMHKGDNSHLHHQLLKLGLKERKVAYIEYLITAVLGIVAFLMTGSFRTVLVLIALVVVGLLVIYLTSLNTKKLEKKVDKMVEKTFK